MIHGEIKLSPSAEAKLRDWAAAEGKDVRTVIGEIVESSLAEDALDPDDLTAIREGLDQAARGEVFTLDEVRDHFHRRGVDLQ